MLIRPIIITITLLIFGFIVPTQAFAQDDDMKSLGEILNPETDYGNNGEPLTSKFMANRYYKECISTESITMNTEEREMLCACNAAKSSQYLTVNDFKSLHEKSKKGRTARGKFLAYSYTKCMPFVVENIFKTDCYKSPKLKDIIVGKKKICSCAAHSFKDYVKSDQVLILDTVLLHHPRSIDPLEPYLQGDSYYLMRDNYINQCKFNFLYERDN
ncbi:MAG: hypothetical protein ACRBDI_00575 [Alphaproteobacteria bacterium]